MRHRESAPRKRYPLPARSVAGTVAACVAVLAGCSSSPPRPAPGKAPATAASAPSQRPGGYYLDDGPGDAAPAGVEATPDPVPRLEPLSTLANRPYAVMGTQYVPDVALRSYRATGIASWYGRRFHGQRTSSGEIYDMYKMTAAHRTLPIPSYLRVRNVANGRTVVVRVNDRGPFLHDRLIDLSYTAALKLGFLGQGSARVEIESVVPPDSASIAAAPPSGDTAGAPSAASSASASPSVPASPPLSAPAAASALSSAPTPTLTMTQALPQPAPAGRVWLQLGAFSALDRAQSFCASVSARLSSDDPVPLVHRLAGLYRVRLGPYRDPTEARRVADRLGPGLGFTPLLGE